MNLEKKKKTISRWMVVPRRQLGRTENVQLCVGGIKKLKNNIGQDDIIHLNSCRAIEQKMAH